MADHGISLGFLSPGSHSVWTVSLKRPGQRIEQEDEGELSERPCGSCQTCKPCTSDHPDQPWKTLFYDFTQDTTFHGIRYITAETRYIIRRILWILLTGIAVSIFLYYVVDRVTEYLQYRTTVSVQEVYVEHMSFPAVTICNQNKIRVTAAAQGGWYEAVDLLNTQASPQKGLRACMGNEFQCNTGKCVPWNQRCDTFPDCPAGDDELGCYPCPLLSLLSSNPNITADLGPVFTLQSHTYSSQLPVYLNFKRPNPTYLYHRVDRWIFGPQVGGKVAYAYVISSAASPQDINSTRWTYLGSGEQTTDATSSQDGDMTFTVGCEFSDLLNDRSDSNDLPEHLAKLQLEHLFRLAGHQQDDFIKRCTWKGRECNSNFFKPRFTDMGLCYTFDGSGKNIEQSGPGFALGLTLNIEQYEYTKDLQTGVGVKMLLHDINDTPMMKERAFAISPGLYTMVAIEKTQLENLPPPWGHCSQRDLHYFNSYTEANCVRDCQNINARRMCGCRDVNMPRRGSDDKPSCTIEQYTNCLIHNSEIPCGSECGKPCLEMKYITSLSFASIATDDDVLKRRSQEKSMAELRDRLAKAREVSYRVQAGKRHETQRVFQMVSLHVSTIYWLLSALQFQLQTDSDDVLRVADITRVDCLELAQRQYDAIEAMRDMQGALDRYIQFYEYKVLGGLMSVKYYLDSVGSGYTPEENHFMGMDDRRVLLTEDDVDINLHNVTITLGRNGMTASTEEAVIEGASVSLWLQDDSMWQKGSQVWTKFVSFRGLVTDLQSSLKVLRNEFRDTMISEIELVPIPELTLNSESLSPMTAGLYTHCDWCVSEEEQPVVALLKQRIATFIQGSLGDDLLAIQNDIDIMYNRYITEEGPDTEDTRSRFSADITGILSRAGEIYQRMNTTLSKPTTAAKRLVQELLRQTDSMCKLASEQQFGQYKVWHGRLKYATDGMLTYVRDYADRFENTKKLYRENNLTLELLSERVRLEALKDHVEVESPQLVKLSKELYLSTQAMQTHITETYNWLHAQSPVGYYQTSDLTDVSDNVLLMMTDMYRPGGSFDSLFDLDQEGSEDRDPQSITDPEPTKHFVHPRVIIPDTSAAVFWFSICSRLDIIETNLHYHQAELSATLTEAQNIFDKFVEGNKINEAFFKKNFLQVDIFYKSLTDKSVIQQRAYEYPTLLGEIGGLMGLLLGASVLTIFELLDLFFYHGAVKCALHCCNPKKLKSIRPQRKANNSNISYTTTTVI